MRLWDGFEEPLVPTLWWTTLWLVHSTTPEERAALALALADLEGVPVVFA